MITASQAAAAKFVLNRRQNGHVQFGEPLQSEFVLRDSEMVDGMLDGTQARVPLNKLNNLG